MSEAKRGTTITEETRKKLSEANRKRPGMAEHMRKMSEANRGKPVSEETLRKRSEARRDREQESRILQRITLGHHKKQIADDEGINFTTVYRILARQRKSEIQAGANA